MEDIKETPMELTELKKKKPKMKYALGVISSSDITEKKISETIDTAIETIYDVTQREIKKIIGLIIANMSPSSPN